MYKQKNNIIDVVHIHTIRHYNHGFQLLYFSSINMDGTAEEWSSGGGSARRQTHRQLDKVGIQSHMLSCINSF